MNKAQLIESVWKVGGYSTKTEAAKAYESVVAAMSGRLAKGGPSQRVIRLPELGTFKMKIRKARTGRNPQTGRKIKIAAKKVVTFKAGKSLSKSL
jgi:nucleoid DNA-binding protein